MSQGANGTRRGGIAFSRGALFHLLRNRLYVGEIPHKGQSYPGQHEAIIPAELFDAVQARLNAQSRRRALASRNGVAALPLTGRIEDADGQPMSPTFAYGRNKRLYRYYVSAPLQQGASRRPNDPNPRRVPAELIERTLINALGAKTGPLVGDPLDRIARITVLPDRLIVLLKPDRNEDTLSDPQCHVLPFQLSTWTGRNEVISGKADGPRRDPVLIRALRKAHATLQRDSRGRPVLDEAPGALRARRILRLALLAPDLQRAILDGTQPRNLTLARSIESDIPLLWSDQKRLFETLS